MNRMFQTKEAPKGALLTGGDCHGGLYERAGSNFILHDRRRPVAPDPSAPPSAPDFAAITARLRLAEKKLEEIRAAVAAEKRK